MKTVQHDPVAQILQDDFPVTFLVSGHQERIATGRWPHLRFVSPWQPAGTLAQQVFQATRSTRAPLAQQRWPRRTLDPSRDLTRLRHAFRGGRLPAAAWASIRPVDLRLVRLGVETILTSTRFTLPGDAWPLGESRRTRATVSMHPLELGWPQDYPRAVWEGIVGDADLFRTTPLGATVLSANYGATRGGLQSCRSCWAFFISPRAQWARRHCDNCRALRPSVSRTRGGLAYWKQQRWQKVLDRMRRRGFARLGYSDTAAQEAWRADALTALHQVSTRAELRAWEDRVAPKGHAGRPRKRVDRERKEEAMSE